MLEIQEAWEINGVMLKKKKSSQEPLQRGSQWQSFDSMSKNNYQNCLNYIYPEKSEIDRKERRKIERERAWRLFFF